MWIVTLIIKHYATIHLSSTLREHEFATFNRKKECNNFLLSLCWTKFMTTLWHVSEKEAENTCTWSRICSTLSCIAIYLPRGCVSLWYDSVRKQLLIIRGVIIL
jgi:hypothetical protein